MFRIEIPEKTSERANIFDKLKSYFKKNFKEKLVDYEEVITELHQLRQNARETSSSKEMIIDYLGKLTILESRFPMTGRKSLNINFSWRNAFKKGKKGSLYDSNFDRTSFLFNLAAKWSKEALKSDLNSDEGVREAVISSQSSSALFDHAAEISGKLVVVPTPDILPSTLRGLSLLMLAQAQACIVEKADRVKMKSFLVAKLSSEASEMYTEAYRLLNSTDFPDKLWISKFEASINYYKVLSMYHYGHAMDTKKKYGMSVGYFRNSLKELQSVQLKKLGKILPEFNNLVNRLIERTKESLEAAERYNDTLYLREVPNSVPKVPTHRMAKPGDLPSFECLNDPFIGIEPPHISEGLSEYSQRVNEIQSTLAEKSSQKNEEITEALDEMGLPGSIMSLTSDGIPEDLLTPGPSLTALIDMLKTLKEISQNSSQMLKFVYSKLREEEDSDMAIRMTYGDKWNRPTSGKLTEDIKMQLARNSSLFESRAKSSIRVEQMINEHRQALQMLENPSSIHIPHQTESISPELKNQMLEMKNLIDRLDEIQVERQLNLSENTTELRKKLTQNPPSLANSIIEEFIRTSTTLPMENIEKGFIEQIELLENLKKLNVDFLGLRSCQSESERDRIINKLAKAISSRNQIMTEASQSIEFFTDFQDTIQRLRIDVEDFIMAREMEKNELLRNLGGGGGSRTTEFQKPSYQQQEIPTYQRQQSKQKVEDYPFTGEDFEDPFAQPGTQVHGGIGLMQNHPIHNQPGMMQPMNFQSTGPMQSGQPVLYNPQQGGYSMLYGGPIEQQKRGKRK